MILVLLLETLELYQFLPFLGFLLFSSSSSRALSHMLLVIFGVDYGQND